MPEDEDAPVAVPEWEPSHLARLIARGHAGSAHFPDLSEDDLARSIQRVMDVGRVKRYGDRTLHWDAEGGLAVLLNPRDPDGGTTFPSDADYFARWGYAEEDAQ